MVGNKLGRGQAAGLQGKPYSLPLGWERVEERLRLGGVGGQSRQEEQLEQRLRGESKGQPLVLRVGV